MPLALTEHDNIVNIDKTNKCAPLIMTLPAAETVIVISNLSYTKTINGINSTKIKYWKIYPGVLKVTKNSFFIKLFIIPSSLNFVLVLDGEATANRAVLDNWSNIVGCSCLTYECTASREDVSNNICVNEVQALD